MNKNTSTMQKYFQVLLAGTSIVFAYLLWLGINSAKFEFEISRMNNNAGEESVMLVFPSIENTLPDIDEFDEMINRPLFFESRQPFVFEEVVEEKKPEKKKTNTRKSREQYALNAVIITPSKKIAIIQSSKAKEVQRIELGEAIDGWTLEKIDPREVLLTNGKDTKTLVLEVKSSSQKKNSRKSNNKTSKEDEIEKRKSSSISSKSKDKTDNLEEKTSKETKLEEKKDEKSVENQ